MQANSETKTAAPARTGGRDQVRKLTVTAMLSAVAFVLMFLDFPIPMIMPSFVKMDFSDLPELLGAFALGPMYGVLISLIKNLIHLLLASSTGGVGELCNFLFGAVFAWVAGFVYKRNKTRRSAVLGAVLGAAAMAIVSIPLNYFLTYPAYVVRDVPGHPALGGRAAGVPGHLQYALDPGQGPAGRRALHADLQAPVAHPARSPVSE